MTSSFTLLQATTAVAAGVLAPWTLLGDLGASAGALIGSWGIHGLAEKQRQDRERRLPDAQSLLENHDLQKLVCLAIGKTLEAAESAEGLGVDKKRLKSMQKGLEEYWSGQRQNWVVNKEALQQLQPLFLVEELAAEGATQECKFGASNWANLLYDLGEWVKESPLADGDMKALSEFFCRRYAQFVIEILKEDFGKRGPLGGRAWAGLSLLVWGRILGELDGIKDLSREMIQQLWNTEDRIGEKIGEIEQAQEEATKAIRETLQDLSKETRQREARILEDLQGLRDEFRDQIQQLTNLLAHSVVPLKQFAEHYWRQQREDLALQTLWEDPKRAKIMVNEIVGREDELARFEDFLENKTEKALFWRGMPGTGKTRLALAAADRARELGWRVLFVEDTVHNLILSLNANTSADDRLLLIWDDFKGEKEEELRSMLTLHEKSSVHEGLKSCKRLVTCWPIFSSTVWGPHKEDPCFVKRDVQELAPRQQVQKFLLDLHPSLSETDAQNIVQRSEANPQASLHALNLFLEGVSIDDAFTKEDILKKSYHRMVHEVTDNKRQSILPPLRTMALLGRLNLNSSQEKAAWQKSKELKKGLERIHELRLVTHESEIYSMSPDLLRKYLVASALDNESEWRIVGGDASDLVALAEPFLSTHFSQVYSICRLAFEEDVWDEVRKELLRASSGRMNSLTEDEARSHARSLFAATVGEDIPARRFDLAKEIGKIRKVHDTAEIALRQAQALANATAKEVNVEPYQERAKEIGEILKEYNTAEIAFAQALVLANATAVEDDAEECRNLAKQIGDIRKVHDTAEIALEQALALANATAERKSTSKQCQEIGKQIGDIRVCDNHDTAEIAFAQVLVLANATDVEDDAEECRNLANQIGDIRKEHDITEIALAQMKALFNVVAMEGDTEECRNLANQIGDIRKEHDIAEIAQGQAMVLAYTTAIDPSSKQTHAMTQAFLDSLQSGTPSGAGTTALVDCLFLLQQHPIPDNLKGSIQSAIDHLSRRDKG